MKKINWNMLNIAIWCEVLLSYVLPFNVVNEFQYKVGFPFHFLSVYDNKIGVSPFASMAVNPLPFAVNVFILYFVIILVLKLYAKLKQN